MFQTFAIVIPTARAERASARRASSSPSSHASRSCEPLRRTSFFETAFSSSVRSPRSIRRFRYAAIPTLAAVPSSVPSSFPGAALRKSICVWPISPALRLCPRVDLPVHDHGAADAGPDPHGDHEVRAAARAETGLRERREADVVLDAARRAGERRPDGLHDVPVRGVQVRGLQERPLDRVHGAGRRDREGGDVRPGGPGLLQREVRRPRRGRRRSRRARRRTGS